MAVGGGPRSSGAQGAVPEASPPTIRVQLAQARCRAPVVWVPDRVVVLGFTRARRRCLGPAFCVQVACWPGSVAVIVRVCANFPDCVRRGGHGGAAFVCGLARASQVSHPYLWSWHRRPGQPCPLQSLLLWKLRSWRPSAQRRPWTSRRRRPLRRRRQLRREFKAAMMWWCITRLSVTSVAQAPVLSPDRDLVEVRLVLATVAILLCPASYYLQTVRMFRAV